MTAPLFHICTRDAWDEAQTRGDYRADSLQTEAFIHCSTPEQIVGTANLRFRGQHGLVVLVIDAGKVTAPIKFEDAGNGTHFPHIYGPLNLDAVRAVQNFPSKPDGTFDSPTA